MDESLGSGVAGADPLTLTCLVCFRKPTSSVATSCGHLFCWPCLYRSWPQGSMEGQCPNCRTGLREGINIIPVYASEQPSGTATSSGTSMAAEHSISDTNDVPRRPNLPPRITPPAAPTPPVRASSSVPARYVSQRTLESEIRLHHRLMCVLGPRARNYDGVGVEGIRWASARMEGSRSGLRIGESRLPAVEDILDDMLEILGQIFRSSRV